MKISKATGLLLMATLAGCATLTGDETQTNEAIAVPTEAEADAAAEAAIDEANADDELLRLQEEIEGAH